MSKPQTVYMLKIVNGGSFAIVGIFASKSAAMKYPLGLASWVADGLRWTCRYSEQCPNYTYHEITSWEVIS